MCSAFTGTAQPPLPLHEFLPAQPASPPLQPPRALHSFLPLQSCLAAADAQPPLPLQAFLPAQVFASVWQPPLPLHALWPLQMCLSAVFSAAFLSSPKTREPAAMPAATAPMIFVNSLRSMLLSLECERTTRLVGSDLTLRGSPYPPFGERCQARTAGPRTWAPSSDRPRGEQRRLPRGHSRLMLEFRPNHMNPDLDRLIRLQRADSDLRRVEAELGLVPRRKAELQAALSAERERLAAARAALDGSQKARRRYEGELQDLEA